MEKTLYLVTEEINMKNYKPEIYGGIFFCLMVIGLFLAPSPPVKADNSCLVILSDGSINRIPCPVGTVER